MVTGQRAWDPPEPIPNSEVKPRSVCDTSVVFGYAKSRKLVATFLTNNPLRIAANRGRGGNVTRFKHVVFKQKKP